MPRKRKLGKGDGVEGRKGSQRRGGQTGRNAALTQRGLGGDCRKLLQAFVWMV